VKIQHAEVSMHMQEVQHLTTSEEQPLSLMTRCVDDAPIKVLVMNPNAQHTTSPTKSVSAALHAENAALRHEVEDLRKRVAELEGEAGQLIA
jgi:uncharacterized protein YceH (UPF0502 family)